MSWRTLLAVSALLAGTAMAETASSGGIYSAAHKRTYFTGLRKDLRKRAPGPGDRRFLTAEVALPKKFDLRERAPAPAIYDQGQCGSCVYNSVMRNLWYSHILRGVTDFPNPSRQFSMDCAAEWSCSGSLFEKVAEGLRAKGGTATEAAYPYRARNQRCQAANATMVGEIESWTIIDNSPKSIMNALYAGYPVSVTVGADGTFSNYSGGRYVSCTNQSTNHETLITGYDVSDAVDASGKIRFDSQGHLPAGLGTWDMDNSWSEGWGDQGSMKIAITSRTGRLCNNIAEEAGVLELKVKPVPPTPPPTPSKPINWSAVGIGAAILLALAALLTALFKK